jgi:hypothetical protein
MTILAEVMAGELGHVRPCTKKMQKLFNFVQNCHSRAKDNILFLPDSG